MVCLITRGPVYSLSRFYTRDADFLRSNSIGYFFYINMLLRCVIVVLLLY